MKIALQRKHDLAGRQLRGAQAGEHHCENERAHAPEHLGKRDWAGQAQEFACRGAHPRTGQRPNPAHALFAGIEKQDQRQAPSTLRNEGGPAGPGYAERRDGTKSEDKYKTEYRVQRNCGAGDD